MECFCATQKNLGSMCAKARLTKITTRRRDLRIIAFAGLLSSGSPLQSAPLFCKWGMTDKDEPLDRQRCLSSFSINFCFLFILIFYLLVKHVTILTILTKFAFFCSFYLESPRVSQLDAVWKTCMIVYDNQSQPHKVKVVSTVYS